ncbi:MAG: hypothetical protein ACRCSQ_10530 [Bacteroidales bacterium]
MNTGKKSSRLLMFTLLLIIPHISFCIDPIPWKDVRSLGMGHIYSALPSFVNPAALSLTSERQILCIYENSFLMKELSSLSACYEQPTRWIDFSLLINYYGYDLFHEIRCGLNVSKLLKPGLSLGVRLFYFNMEYVDCKENVSVFSGDIGLQYQPVENLTVGMLITNPFRVSYKQSESEYDLPLSMEIGLRYLFSEGFTLTGAIEKDPRYPICFKGGVAYQIEKIIELRAGILSSPFIPTAGIGLRYDQIRIDGSFSYHNVLGFSPAVSIHYYF